MLDERAIAGENWALSSNEEQEIFDKMRSVSISLEEYTNKKVYFGIKTGYNKAFVIDSKTRQDFLSSDENSGELIRPFVVGNDIRKYTINFSDKYLIRIPKGWTDAKRGTTDAWKWLRLHILLYRLT